jgi:hypothetical protein
MNIQIGRNPKDEISKIREDGWKETTIGTRTPPKKIPGEAAMENEERKEKYDVGKEKKEY